MRPRCSTTRSKTRTTRRMATCIVSTTKAGRTREYLFIFPPPAPPTSCLPPETAASPGFIVHGLKHHDGVSSLTFCSRWWCYHILPLVTRIGSQSSHGRRETRPAKSYASTMLMRHHRRWDDWVPQERLRKFTDENKELASNLKKDMDAQRRAASGKPASTSTKKRAFGSDLASSARGSEDRSSVAPPPPPRGTKRGREIEGIDKVSLTKICSAFPRSLSCSSLVAYASAVDAAASIPGVRAVYLPPAFVRWLLARLTDSLCLDDRRAKPTLAPASAAALPAQSPHSQHEH